MEIHLLRLLLFPVLAYLIILTIDTPHIAIAEEYCPRPPTSRKNWLLTVVSTDRRNYGQISRMAKPQLAFKAIDSAFPWANFTGS